MPNWCENELTISGPDVRKVLEAIRSESHEDEDARLLDFNRIIPYPQVYRDIDRRAREYQEKLRAIGKDDPDRQQKLEVLAAEHGVEPGAPWIKDGYNSGGYEWCCSNWMTKWNACNVRLITCEEGARDVFHKTAEPRIQASLEFDTAWSPPLPVIEKLAGMFPGPRVRSEIL